MTCLRRRYYFWLCYGRGNPRLLVSIWDAMSTTDEPSHPYGVVRDIAFAALYDRAWRLPGARFSALVYIVPSPYIASVRLILDPSRLCASFTQKEQPTPSWSADLASFESKRLLGMRCQLHEENESVHPGEDLPADLFAIAGSPGRQGVSVRPGYWVYRFSSYAGNHPDRVSLRIDAEVVARTAAEAAFRLDCLLDHIAWKVTGFHDISVVAPPPFWDRAAPIATDLVHAGLVIRRGERLMKPLGRSGRAFLTDEEFATVRASETGEFVDGILGVLAGQ